jgi:hypothetical protein
LWLLVEINYVTLIIVPFKKSLAWLFLFYFLVKVFDVGDFVTRYAFTWIDLFFVVNKNLGRCPWIYNPQMEYNCLIFKKNYNIVNYICT